MYGFVRGIPVNWDICCNMHAAARLPYSSARNDCGLFPGAGPLPRISTSWVELAITYPKLAFPSSTDPSVARWAWPRFRAATISSIGLVGV